MNYDEWARMLVTAASGWATSSSADIRDLQRSGFVLGAQGKPCPYAKSPDFTEFDQKIYAVAAKAGTEWAEQNPMPMMLDEVY
jgi:hypothetical protein